MTATRTDVHRPGNLDTLDPNDYGLIDVFDLSHENKVREAVDAAKLAVGATVADHQKDDHCGHCGVRLRYAALLVHVPTNELIFVGETCLNGRFAGTKAQFKALREAARIEAERTRSGQRQIEHIALAVAIDWRLEILGNRDAVAALPGSLAGFGLDLLANARKWALTPRQIAAFGNALDRERTEKEPKPEPKPVPEGVIDVTGKIVSFKWDSYGYVSTLKMLVEHPDGWRVFGTCPRNLAGDDSIDRGTVVTFKATVTASPDDPSFGFFSRPRNASIVPAEID